MCGCWSVGLVSKPPPQDRFVVKHCGPSTDQPTDQSGSRSEADGEANDDHINASRSEGGAVRSQISVETRTCRRVLGADLTLSSHSAAGLKAAFAACLCHGRAPHQNRRRELTQIVRVWMCEGCDDES